MKIPREAKDIPTGHHYAILVFTSVSSYEAPWHPRDNGQGTYSETPVTNYYVTTNREEWEKQIVRFDERKEKFVAFEVNGLAKLTKKVSITIESQK